MTYRYPFSYFNLKNIKRFTQTLCCTLALSAPAQFADAQEYVRTDGTRIVDENGEELFLSGINLGNWLVWEGYLMMGDFNFRTHTQFFNELSSAFGSSDKAAEFEYQWRLNYVDEKAIADLKALGFNSVRVPFNYNLFWWNGELRDNGFEYFDRVIEWCRKYDMYVLLDMHGAPGYQNPGDHADNVNSNANQPRGSVAFWDDNNVQIAATIWRHIAERYKNEPVVWGYDLTNEPVPQAGREFELLPSYVTIRNAIREVDTNHILVAEGNWWGSDLTKIDWNNAQTQAETGINYQWDDKLVYQIHHYGPVADTVGRETITNNLNIPLIIGEYGETDEQNLLAITNWAKENLAGYFPWSFKKMSHDKTLWTIPPNDAYEQVKSYIKNGGNPPTHLYDAMISFAQNNIRNGHSSHIWHQGFYDGVKPSASATNCATAYAHPVPGRIEAESFCENQGVELETTSDTGGGQNIGFIDGGDHTAYNVNIANSGTYTFSVRVASLDTSGLIDVQLDGNNVASFTTPVTSGWQTFETISTVASLPAGEHTLRLDFPAGGFNLNWINIAASNTSGELQRGTYYITNIASGKALDVADAATSDGANVQLWDYFYASNQQWLVEPITDNMFELKNLNSNACLDADNGSDNVHQWSCFGSSNQRWYVEADASGFFTIRSAANNEALEVANGTTANGGNVRTYPANGSAAQQWRFHAAL
ncbi:cellulase family glycosylhydrolase [Alteromonas pelagimontana]|uniref:Cellulase family glycosylhydrolase n=1 Tax=Alteromonas pelagimontana TaxID=1858656 RepID=A0A6M4MDK0_9ALTE|nr:RICIN domain-containing protein [Alteromonas pelagimontana]QJR80710.1 cellulase family glycosylhydrolase [Alteromonas pelagimontana]